MRLDEGVSDETSAAPEPESGGRGWAKGCLGLAVLAFAIPAGCAALLSMGGGSEWEPTATEAESTCKEWVRDRLKSPATARFSGVETTGGRSTYDVSGAVDSENSFGALVRTAWTCDVRYDAATEQWRGGATLLD